MTNGTHSDAAKLFYEFLQSKEAKDIFTKYGFTIVE
jgi:ABC-type molybdate transport system substrate-binding protein